MGTMMTRSSFLKGAGALTASSLALSGLETALADETTDTAVCSATVASMKGDIQVFVVLENGAIAEVAVIDEVDTPGIREVAIESICPRVVESQNIEVDTVAGATLTSFAILNGIETALESAGIDTSPFKKGSDAVANKEEAPEEEFDVVVVGSGMAGMAAADLLARNGASVVVLEKLAVIGGSSRVCGGGIWAMGSQANELIGQDCSLDDYLSFMEEWSAPTVLNTELMGNIREVSGETFDYLYNWGLPVTASGWSLGNSECQLPVFWSTAGVGAPWENGASGLMDFMTTRVKQDGAEIRTNSRAVELVVEDGAVTGVRVETPTSIYTAKAKQVILASGGFTRNLDLIERYAPEYVDAFAFTAAGCTGDGITLTADLGATVVGTGMMGLTGLNPALGYYGKFGSTVNISKVTVNANGEEFGLNKVFYGKSLKLLLEQPGTCGYGISDATIWGRARLEEAVKAGYATSYDTIEELAEGEGIDADNLLAVCAENDIKEPPFFCVIKRPLFIGSIPGLKVSATCEVLDANDEPIEGLRAAGELIFGNVFSNAYPCSGTGVGTSCYTGTVAARAALEMLES